MNTPRISLVIPAYNEENYIGACLDSVVTHAGNKLAEIIVIDNASTDRTASIAGQFRGVRVVREEKKGLTSARQRGLTEARGDFVAYIDADTKIYPGWFERAMELYEKRPDAVCVSGPYHYYDGTRLQRGLMDLLWWLTGPLTYTIVGYMVLGGNFVARKSALHAMGGFDTNIEFYGEDTDLAKRLSKHGKVLFSMDFFIYTSMRRMVTEGIFKSSFSYAINYLWEVFFGKPYTKQHRDIRLKTGNAK